jgi:hypothetical protein
LFGSGGRIALAPSGLSYVSLGMNPIRRPNLFERTYPVRIDL